MKALQYTKSVPRYALMRWVGPRFRSLYTSSLSPVSLVDVAPPKLPNSRWLRIKPRLTGICGSDLATLCASGSPYLSPLTSMPFVLGHETVGIIDEVGDEVDGFSVGDRVVLQPALGCVVRGIQPLCSACAQGKDALCENVTRGDISAGIQTGYCRDTGGGFSSSLVAHPSQVFRVPNDVEDSVAVLIEPFACALHAALRASPKETDTVLVIGCGAIGLLTIAALRATGCVARILAVARFDHQAERAKAFGATETLPAMGDLHDRYHAWSQALDADVLQAELGKPTVVGGADVTYDCIASSQTMDDGVRFTRSGGTLVLVGMPGIPKGVDFTPLWFKELTVRAAYAYGHEQRTDDSPRTFDLAIELMQQWQTKLAPLVSAPFALADYRSAFRAALGRGRGQAVKMVMAIDE